MTASKNTRKSRAASTTPPANESGDTGLTLVNPNALEHVDPEPEPYELDQEESELDRVFAELGGESSLDAKVMVYRIRKDSPKDIFMFECLPPEFSLQTLAEKYGGGKFRVRVYVRRENGQRSLAANQIVEIEPPLVGAIPGSSTGTPANDTMTRLLEKLDRLTETRQLDANPAVNPMQQFKEIITMASLMREAFGGAPAVAQTSSPLEMLKMMRELKEVGADLFGGNGGGSVQSDFALLANTARDFLPVIREAIQQPPQPVALAQIPQVPQPARAPMPQTRTPLQTNPATPKPSQEDQEMSLMISLYLKQLARKAAENADPAPQADALLDLIPESALPDFLAKLERDDWFTGLTQLQQTIAPHRAWFDRLRAEILAQFEDDAPGELTGTLNDGKTGNNSVTATPSNAAITLPPQSA